MGRRGIAQVVVLWALLLLGAIATAFAFAMRTEARAARNGADAARAYFQARTGINRVIMLFSVLPADNVLRQAIAGADEDSGYEVDVQSESGKIDINWASEKVIKEVLKRSGLSEDEAESVGDAILDWRDADDHPRPRGAEEADYAGLPEPIKPRNGLFLVLDELRSVKGVTRELYRDLLSRAFTVYGRSPLVNINAAPSAVLGALGLSAEQAEKIIARRKEAPFRVPAEVTAFMVQEGMPQSVLPYLTTASASNVYTITARGIAADGIVHLVRCRVEVGGAVRGGIRIVRWEDLVPAAEEGR